MPIRKSNIVFTVGYNMNTPSRGKFGSISAGQFCIILCYLHQTGKALYTETKCSYNDAKTDEKVEYVTSYSRTVLVENSMNSIKIYKCYL